MMFLYSLLSLLLLIGQTNAQNNLEISDQRVNYNEELLTTSVDASRAACDFAEQIQQNGSLISITNNTGNVINQPGQYCVVENLSVPANRNGIIIEADNVTIDLNGFCITGATNSFNGILVRRAAGDTTMRTNITIRNGAIRNMGSNGILFNTAAQGVLLDNLKILNCRNNGINMAGIQQLIMKNIITSRNNFNGILIFQSGSTLNNNCIITNCLSTFNGTDGIQLISCLNFNITNMLCFNNSFVGFDEFSSNRIHFANCQAYNNGRTNTAAIGFFCEGNNNSYEQCIANNNVKIGFQLSVNGNNGNGNSINNCQAKSNGVNGYQIAGANHCILNNEAKLNTTTGFLLATNSNQCQVRGNTAVANGTGFANNTTTVNRIYSNFASDNTTNFMGVPNVSTSPGILTPINFTANIAN